LKVLIIDNKDSFTYNLYHYVEQFAKYVDVYRANSLSLQKVGNYDKIIFSPGPGLPSEHEIMFKILDVYKENKSILGICLGHQAIAEYFGCSLFNLNKVKHGVSSKLTICGNSIIFKNVPSNIQIGHYHSWVISHQNIPNSIIVTSVNTDNLIMSIEHKKYDIMGLQFHPESIMTDYGLLMLKNWVNYSQD
tara:strand:+ start:1917 stop:2489 length:573 start_codon:yes stop_codon:yes gene_type:complete